MQAVRSETRKGPSMVRDKLSLWTRLRIRLFGPMYLHHRMLEGWTGYLPFYLCRCLRHGFYESYPSGYEGVLHCPMCLTHFWDMWRAMTGAKQSE